MSITLQTGHVTDRDGFTTITWEKLVALHREPKVHRVNADARSFHDYSEPRADETEDEHKERRGEFKKRIGYVMLARMTGEGHKLSDVLARTGCSLDYDAKKDTLPFEEACKRLDAVAKKRGFRWVGATTTSHTEDSPCYRFHILYDKSITREDFPSDAEFTSEHKRRMTLLVAEADLAQGLDPQSYRADLPMYLPKRWPDTDTYEHASGGRGDGWRAPAPEDEAEYIAPHHDRLAAVREQARKAVRDIPIRRSDPVLDAIRRVGMYREKDPRKEGGHFITCPFHDQHNTDNPSKTEYWEAHYGGNPYPGVKCQSASHEPLNYGVLTKWLRDEGHLTAPEAVQALDAGPLEGFDDFANEVGAGKFLEQPPPEREWPFWPMVAAGTVSIIVGMGGTSKSMLALTSLMHAALGLSFGDMGPRNLRNPPKRGLKCLYIGYEDDINEIWRRVHRIAEHLWQQDGDDRLRARFIQKLEAEQDVEWLTGDLTTAAVKERAWVALRERLNRNLHLVSVYSRGGEWSLATLSKDGEVIRTGRGAWLAEFVVDQGHHCICLDPWADVRDLDENSPLQMTQFVIKVLEPVVGSKEPDSERGLVVLHHTPKSFGQKSVLEWDLDMVRGSSRIGSRVRHVMALGTLPEADAVLFGVAQGADKHAVLKIIKSNVMPSPQYRVYRRVTDGMLEPTDHVLKEGVERVVAKKVQQAKQEREVGTAVSLEWVDAVLDYMHKNPMPQRQTTICNSAGVTTRQHKPVFNLLRENKWVEKADGQEDAKSPMLVLTKSGEREAAKRLKRKVRSE